MPSLKKPKSPSTYCKNVGPRSSPPPSPARSTCAGWRKRRRHEPAQRNQLRERNLRAPGRPWLAVRGRRRRQYDRARALFPDDVLAWVQATQPKAWEALSQEPWQPARPKRCFAASATRLDQRGTLDVLRHGIELLGLRGKLSLAQFKPALAMNPDILARYAANRLRVVRQVRYSLHNENSIDLVLFLNGMPVATAELKTDFTQSIGDAIDQYRFDRHPKPKGQAAEPLLSFPERGPGAFRGQQPRSLDDDEAGRHATPLPAVQPGRQRRGRQSGEPGRRPPHRLSVGSRSGSGRAGWKSWAATWSPRRTRRSRSPRSSSPAFTSSTPPGSCRPRC